MTVSVDLKASELFKKVTHQSGLYNIQAIKNVPSIMKYGLLSNSKAKNISHISIAMEKVQKKRDRVLIPNGLMLHQYANVYFDPRNPMLSARRKENGNICILKFSCEILDIYGTVVSDMNASSKHACFYTPVEGLKSINFNFVYAKYWIDNDPYVQSRKKSIKCAEVLVPYRIPFSYVLKAAVVNQHAKVRLEKIGFNKTIEICPSIFFKE